MRLFRVTCSYLKAKNKFFRATNNIHINHYFMMEYGRLGMWSAGVLSQPLFAVHNKSVCIVSLVIIFCWPLNMIDLCEFIRES